MSLPYESPTPVDAELIPPSGTSGKAIASLVLGIGSFLCSIFTGIPALILGILSLGEITKSNGRLSGRGMAITGIVLSVAGTFVQIVFVLIGLLLPAIATARAAARRTMSSYNLKQIELATDQYEEATGSYPNPENQSHGENRRQVSWRVKLLPYLELKDVYNRYDVRQAWDSAANRAVSDFQIPIFHNPSDPDPASNKTNYLAVVGPGTVSESGKTVRPEDLINGTSNTILYVEANADHAVPWAQPKDLDYDPADPLRGVGSYRPQGFVVAFADGSVRTLPRDIDPKVFAALVSRSGDHELIQRFIDDPAGAIHSSR